MAKEKFHVNPKEDLFKRTSEELGLPVEIVEKVVSWGYMQANKAIREKPETEVEMSGLGKFLISQTKVRRRINTIEARLTFETNEKRIELLKEEMQLIKTKLKDDAEVNGASITVAEGIEESREGDRGNIE